jgi:hypothetical protein
LVQIELTPEDQSKRHSSIILSYLVEVVAVVAVLVVAVVVHT